MKTTTALVTGASSGIGYELAKILAREGHSLVLVARSIDRLNELKNEIEKSCNVTVDVLPYDLSVIGNCEKLFQDLKNRGVNIDILVNNAGFGDFGKFAQGSWEKYQQMIDLNITSLTYLTKLFLAQMISRKNGKILNVASTAAFQAGPLMAVYYATKAYVLSFSEAINNELRGTGVTVTALCPGPTQSGFLEAASLEKSKLLRNRRIPTSKSVAEYGYKAMMSEKTVAIHGYANRLLVFSERFVPRSLIVRIVRMIQEVVK